MNPKTHFKLLLIALNAWLAFYFIGLSSNYYQDWSSANQILLSLIAAFAAVPLIAFITLVLIGNDYLKISLWFAFYASVPLAIVDFIVGGVIQKNGLNIFISHWYVTIGYFYVWIIIPLVGYFLVKLKQNVNNE
ncbi:MAG: hypothetical protein C0597_10270 [Marinilabiliales bacterium]|nr:MAG: hypothetical protein C0597_10270 [Marinilabiliales bacterium]